MQKRSYGYKPKPKFFDRGDSQTIPFIGIELEIEFPDEDAEYNFLEELGDEDFFYAKRDGSLSDYGVEIVSHPAKLEFWRERGKEELIRMTTLAMKHGGTSHDNDTCGLHVHISRSGLSSTHVKNIATLVENLSNLIYRVSRRRKSRLVRWGRFCFAEIGYVNTIFPDYFRLSGNRYRALNTTNRSTLEFRFARGTLRVETILATIEFCYLLYKLGKNFKVEPRNYCFTTERITKTRINRKTYYILTNVGRKGIENLFLNYVLNHSEEYPYLTDFLSSHYRCFKEYCFPRYLYIPKEWLKGNNTELNTIARKVEPVVSDFAKERR